MATLLAGATLGAPIVSHGAPPDDVPIAVVDLHVDIPYQVHFKGRSSAPLAEGHARVDALTRGRYGAVVFPIYLPDKNPQRGDQPSKIADADAIFATIEHVIADNPVFLPLRSMEAKEDRIVAFLSIEGGGAFAEDVAAIDRFIERGLRLVSPCHAANSPLASSATGDKVAYGLTDKGKELCERVYDKGALVDVSHVSDASFEDIAAIAKAHGAPIVATHSNARAIANVPRNLTDAELRAIAESGGVAGVNFHSHFVTGNNRAKLADVVKQVEHMVKVAGVDHVAIGSDFDGGIQPAKGLEDAGTFPKLAKALQKRGMRYDDVLKIFSLNALRVLGWQPIRRSAPPAPPPPADPPPPGSDPAR